MLTSLFLLAAAQGPSIAWHSPDYSQDGKLLLAAINRQVKVWEAKNGRALLLVESRADVMSALFDRNNKSILVASRDGTLRRFPLPAIDPKRVGPVEYKHIFMETGLVGKAPRGTIFAMDVAPDGSKVALSYETGFGIVDSKTGDTLQMANGALGTGSVHFAKNGTHVVATDLLNGIAMYDLSETPPKELFNVKNGTHGSPRGLSPSGRYYAMGNQNSNVGVIDFEKSAMHHSFNVPKKSWVDVLAWSKDESRYYVGGNHGDVWIVGFPAGKIMKTFKVAGRVGGFAIHPDGKTIAIAADAVLQYQAASGKPLGR